MKINKKVLVIALDAAESTLIEKWMEEGFLKNLASLRSKGAFGKLSSSAEWLAGSPWPTFYTGTLPSEHGFYHYLQWKSDKMKYERPGPDWINAIPFWRRLGDHIRVVAVDIPLTFPPTPFNGVEISGWASHDRIYPTSSFPKEKINWVIKNFGKPPINTEVGGILEINDLLNIKDELIHANKKETDLVTSLIKREEWDLFFCCFTSTHRAGHKLWDLTNVKGDYSERQKNQFKSALKEIYQSCDGSIGEIINCINEDTTILIFSLHGMGPNITLADKMLPQMISNILNSEDKMNKENNMNIIKKIRNIIPLEIRANLRKLLPFWLQDKMTAYWRMGGIDWNKTKVFNLLADLQGYLRINLKGREKEGIVEKGEAYNQLCNKLIEGIKSFKDEKTLEPVIESINRTDHLFEKGPGFNNLPDILVKWKLKPVANYTTIVSDEYGELKWPLPKKNPDGRSGNHCSDGFLLAVGEHFKMNSTFEKKYHIIDLAPTILNLFNIQKLKEMKGNIIS
jgi:predicted AlkP superfamily phosphohydrolase/phosphomutase